MDLDVGGVTADFADDADEGVAMAAHDEAIGVGDVGGFVGDGEGEVVVEAARALDDGAASAGAAEDRNAEAFAGIAVYFGGDFVGVAEDHEGRGRFPETEGGFAVAGFEFFEESFVAGEVVGGGIERAIQKAQRICGGFHEVFWGFLSFPIALIIEPTAQ